MAVMPSCSPSKQACATQTASGPFLLQWIGVLLLITLLSGLVFVSRESLWIDEGLSAYFATQPDFGSFLHAMHIESSSDSQLPFFQTYLWVWEKGFGHSEMALRLANLPWLLLGNALMLVALLRSGMRRSLGVFFILAAATSPFLAFYLNQARCYTMQYACACLILAYLVEIAHAPQRVFALPSLAVGLGGIFLLCGTSLVAVVWGGTALLAAYVLVRQGQGRGVRIPAPSRGAWMLMGMVAAGLVALGLYYLSTLLRGARATGGTTNLSTALYCVYEMLGFLGLGPARNDLRDSALGALKAYAPQLILGGGIIFGVLVSGGIAVLRRTSERRLVWPMALILLPLLFMFGMGVAVHFRVLGRHLMALFPLLLFLVALALDALFATRRWKLLPVLFLLVWMGSAGMLRFSATHHREDYRSAAALARQSLTTGKSVWWVADQATAAYYGLKQGEQGLSFWFSPEDTDLVGKPEPDLVCVSKRDIYDRNNTLESFLTRHGFVPTATYTAFTVFEKRR